MIVTRITLAQLNYQGLVCIMFAYHMRDDTTFFEIGTLDVVLVKEQPSETVSLWVAHGEQGTAWLTASIDTAMTETDTVGDMSLYLSYSSHNFIF